MSGTGQCGRRLRRLREQRGLTQAELARRLHVSPSYLSLIEHDRRPLPPPLLHKVAGLFAVEGPAIEADQEAPLVAELDEVCADPIFRGQDIPRAQLAEVASTAPAVGRALVSLYRAYHGRAHESRAWSERLASDSGLSSAGHQLFTLITSIRLYAEILRDNPDLGAPRRRRFLESLVHESERITDLARKLFDLIRGEDAQRPLAVESPAEAVNQILLAHNNHYPALEAAADALRAEIGAGVEDGTSALADYLGARHGQRVELVQGEVAPGDGDSADGGRLLLSAALPTSSRRFRIARRIARLSCARQLERQIERAALVEPAARALYHMALVNYVAGAMLLPYAAFREAARSLRHDVDLLQERFGASFEQVCHRLSTLQRPGARGVPFHFLRVDIAGNLSKSFSASGLRVPRYGGVCPRWNVHSAFLDANRIHRQVIRLVDGSAYFSVARVVTKPAWGQRSPRSHYALGLGCDISFASHMVYADGLDLDDPGLATPAGTTCRTCERLDCAQRAAPFLGPGGGA